ncbi:MAG: DNA polymerase III [Betaproteobacteria bacterium RIFCSPLOWO2_12_FULL_62_13]|nr:MAG: DNA polymerase III [Betaproteobacteria bacterium RIFCSPLOWO2_12_FULL_62_13]
MPIHNADIAAVFEEIADLLEIRDENPFRIRAYRNAARTVGEFARDLKTLLDQGQALPKLPGVGADLEAKIHEICASGACGLLERLHREMPAAITELLKIPGLGPKRVRLLHEVLDIDTIDALRRAARSGRIREVPGFGEKTERQILQALEQCSRGEQRVKLAVAAQYAEALVAHLKSVPGVALVTVAGSFRRMRETVGDLDILVAARAAGPVMERLRAYDEVKEVLASGETRSSVVLRSGLQVDVRVVPRESHGAALHYFTGSKAHNIAIRRLGQDRGLKINEYGVFRGENRIAGDTEESVFEAVGLPFIPPELREDRGEIEAARRGELPRLVTLQDLKGDLHLHTKASDGHNSIKEMALAAKAAGLAYVAITEHSRRLTVAHGLDPRGVLKQIDEIDRLNGELTGITVLKGIEVDILEDGGLDLPDSVLKRLDIVVGAVHSAFNLPRRKQTERILRAMDNPCFTLLAHPSGRLLGEREACDVDMLKIVRKAKRRGCFLELNAQPDRLDLNDIHCQMARDEGVLVAVNSDAHSTHDFAHLRYGIGQARRGWLTPEQVLNTRPLGALRELLNKTRW